MDLPLRPVTKNVSVWVSEDSAIQLPKSPGTITTEPRSPSMRMPVDGVALVEPGVVTNTRVVSVLKTYVTNEQLLFRIVDRRHARKRKQLSKATAHQRSKLRSGIERPFKRTVVMISIKLKTLRFRSDLSQRCPELFELGSSIS